MLTHSQDALTESVFYNTKNLLGWGDLLRERNWLLYIVVSETCSRSSTRSRVECRTLCCSSVTCSKEWVQSLSCRTVVHRTSIDDSIWTCTIWFSLSSKCRTVRCYTISCYRKVSVTCIWCRRTHLWDSCCRYRICWCRCKVSTQVLVCKHERYVTRCRRESWIVSLINSKCWTNLWKVCLTFCVSCSTLYWYKSRN